MRVEAEHSYIAMKNMSEVAPGMVIRSQSSCPTLDDDDVDVNRVGRSDTDERRDDERALRE